MFTTIVLVVIQGVNFLFDTKSLAFFRFLKFGDGCSFDKVSGDNLRTSLTNEFSVRSAKRPKSKSKR